MSTFNLSLTRLDFAFAFLIFLIADSSSSSSSSLRIASFLFLVDLVDNDDLIDLIVSDDDFDDDGLVDDGFDFDFDELGTGVVGSLFAFGGLISSVSSSSSSITMAAFFDRFSGLFSRNLQ